MMFLRIKMHSQLSVLHKNIQKYTALAVIPCTNFHSGELLHEKARSKKIGNKYLQPVPELKYAPPMWKHHWLLLMKRKAEIEGEEEPRRRSDQLNWNYAAELRAFAHRLHIRVHADTLKTAFTEPMPLDDDVSDTENGVSNIDNNIEMAGAGKTFCLHFVSLFVKSAFPDISAECSESVVNYLVSEELISYLAKNLGFSDLIQSQTFPLTNTSLAQSFFAVVSAILQGPGGKTETAKFIYDFVIVNLHDKDIVHDIWKPKDPMKYLAQELQIRREPPPEVRMTKQSGITSMLPIVFVGIFCDKELLAESGGESVIKAELDAAKLALKKIYGVHFNRCVLNNDLFSDAEFMNQVESLDISKHVFLENEPLDRSASV